MSEIIRDMKYTLSAVEITPDGQCIECLTDTTRSDIFIDESQAHKLWDPKVALHILKCYGNRVSVLHESLKYPMRPVVKTRQNALGC